jgi:phosphoribosylformylglycinamidine cyclo-ligase
MTDYIACGKLVPERIAAIVSGIAEACAVAGCALVGGETAEHPGLLGTDEYDVAGAATGVVDEANLLGAHRIIAGDAIIAMGSSGPHANGYSLLRHVFFAIARWDLSRQVEEFGRTLGEELLEPTKVYAADCLALARTLDVHAMAHITGGGLASNVARVLPGTVDAVVDRSTWAPQPIFGLTGRAGGVAQDELERTLNMGIGMVAIVPADHAGAVVRFLTQRRLTAWIAGAVVPGSGQARLEGSYAR